MPPDARGAAIPDEVARRYRASTPRYAGQTSVLYDGLDPTTGVPVLVKVVRDEALPSAAERQRALRELQKLVQVRHPALASIVAAGDDAGRIWLVREAVQGESLQERMSSSGPLSAGECARIASQIAAGLGELHRHGVLHRDVRPGHVLLDSLGGVKLIDAGIARVFRSPDGRVGIGTPGYVAPEAIAGKLVSFRSDLYSLGAVLFEMLTGSAPYGPPDTPNVLAAQSQNDAPALRVPSPPALGRLVASLLSREPRERPFSAQQLERQLEPLATVGSPGGGAMDDPAAMTVVGDPPEDDATMMLDGGTPHAIAAPTAAAASAAGRKDFDDEAPTRVGDSPLRPAESPPTRALTPRPATTPPPVRTPLRSPSGAMAAARAAGAPPPAKSTLLGISTAAGSAVAAAIASAEPKPAKLVAPNEGSGRVTRPPRDTSGDFDSAQDTVVTEDSRIFGVPELTGASPHGSAVPPLPGGVAQRVLTGTLRGPTPDPRGPHSTPSPVANVPAAQPLNPFQAALGQSGMPGRLNTGGPRQTGGNLPVAPSFGSAPMMPPGYGAVAPPAALTLPPPAPGVYANTATAAPPQAPPLFAAHAATSDADGLSRRALIPWVLAAIGVAGIAGAGGYVFATRDRAPTPVSFPAPVLPVVRAAIPPTAAPPKAGAIAPVRVIQPVAPVAVPQPVAAVPAPSPAPAPVATAPAPATRTTSNSSGASNSPQRSQTQRSSNGSGNGTTRSSHTSSGTRSNGTTAHAGGSGTSNGNGTHSGNGTTHHTSNDDAVPLFGAPVSTSNGGRTGTIRH